MEDTPHLRGARLYLLTLADAPRLQSLFERCRDFFELVEGEPARPGTAVEELTFAAHGKTVDDTICFGVEVEERLVGFVQLIRDYPKPSEWWIALMLLDPSERSRGLGERLDRAVEEWIAAKGATVLWGGVLLQNEAAQRFWSRIGYVERERQPYVASSGLRTTVILVSRPVANATQARDRS